MKKELLILLVLVCGAFATGGCNGATANFTCNQTVTQSCTMNESLACASYGFIIGAHGITLDGNGMTLNYTQTALGLAIYDSAGYDNITIKNFNIKQTNASIATAVAIYMTGLSGGDIHHNNITTTSNSAHGILGNGASSYNNVHDNNISAAGGGNVAIYFSTSSVFNNVSNNTIYVNNGVGVRLYSASSNCRIVSNNITNLGNYGMYVDTGTTTNTYIYNNSITSNFYAVGLSGATNSNVSNNVITVSAGATAGVLLSSGSNNTLNSNTISHSSGGYGVNFLSTQRNILTNNNITTVRAIAIVIDASITGELPTDMTYASYNQSIDTTNLAEGLPILFNYSVKNQVVLQNTNVNATYGQIICASCLNVTYDNVTAGNDGISFFAVRDSTIKNSRVVSDNGFVTLYTNSYGNTITNNTIIQPTASKLNMYGIYLVTANANNISNNVISTAGTNVPGVFVSAYGNNLINNNITTTGQSSYVIQIGGKGNVVDNNVLTSSGGNNAHPIVDTGGENTYTNNIINVLGSSTHGAYITSADSIYINNTFNNSIAGGYSAFTLGNNAHRNRIINSTLITTSAPVLLIYTSSSVINSSVENSAFASTSGAHISSAATSSGTLQVINCSSVNLANVSFVATSNVTVNIQSWNEMTANYSNGSLVEGARINYTDMTNQTLSYFTGADLPEYGAANDVINMTGNVLYLKMNETSGTLIDYSGTQNATANNTQYGSDGILNRTGMYIGGSNSTTRRWIDVGDNPAHNLTSNITVLLWVKFREQSQWCDSFSKGYDAAWAFKGTTTPTWRLQLTTNGDKQVSFTAPAINRWYMLVGTFNGTDSRAYRDGLLAASTTVSLDTIKTTTYRVMLGMDSQSATYGDVYPAYPACDEWIGEAAIWNRTLSAAEIASIYESTKKQYVGQSESIGMTNISMNRTANTTATNYTMTAYKNVSSVVRTAYPQTNIATNFLFILDTCTAPMSGDWTISCADNCAITSPTTINGSITMNGTGKVDLNATLSFTGAGRQIAIFPGCQLNIHSNGRIN